MPELHRPPVARAEMTIRRPAEDVFEAFVDPSVTTNFWFTSSSGRLEAGKTVRWEWEMYGAGDDVTVLAVEPNRRIRIACASDGTETEWTFTPRSADATHVVIEHSGFRGDGDDVVGQAIDAMGGYTMTLCGAKAYLEHGIRLNLVADKSPDRHANPQE